MVKDDTAKEDPSEPTTPDGATRRPSLAELQHMEEVNNDVVGHE